MSALGQGERQRPCTESTVDAVVANTDCIVDTTNCANAKGKDHIVAAPGTSESYVCKPEIGEPATGVGLPCITRTGTAAVEAESAGRESATIKEEPSATEHFYVPQGLWCYRLDRERVVLGGSLTDGGSALEWVCKMLDLVPGEARLDAVMKQAEEVPPASHGLVVRFKIFRTGMMLA